MKNGNDARTATPRPDDGPVSPELDDLLERSSFGAGPAKSLRRRADSAAVDDILRLICDRATTPTAVQPPAEAQREEPPPFPTPAPPLEAWRNGKQWKLHPTWQQALRTALPMRTALTKEDVWKPLDAHVATLNKLARNAVLTQFKRLERRHEAQPDSVVITGERGSGKTHLFRDIRERVQQEGGFFFLVELLYGRGFWSSILHSLLTGLRRPSTPDRDQITATLERLAHVIDLRQDTVGRLMTRPSKSDLDSVITALRRAYPDIADKCHCTARALMLFASADTDTQDLGESYLSGLDEDLAGELELWGIDEQGKSACDVVGEISALLALAGPTVLAVDQLDTLIAQSYRASDVCPGEAVGARQQTIAEQVRAGLTELRETMRRTVTVIACLPRSWELIDHTPTRSAAAHFCSESRLGQVDSGQLARDLAAAHLKCRFRDVSGFAPPYSTWPVSPSAFTDLAPLTPRQLLTLIDDHLGSCVERGVLTEMTTLSRVPAAARAQEPVADREQLALLDARFMDLLATAGIGPMLDRATEDALMPNLLKVALASWVSEQTSGHAAYSLDTVHAPHSTIHARLRLALDSTRQDEIHWAFRSVAATGHSALSVRMERLRVASGLDPQVDKRKVFLLSAGKRALAPRTQRMLTRFAAEGGILIDVEPADLRVLTALESMWTDRGNPLLVPWLRQRQLASRTALFQTALEPGEPAAASPPEHRGVELALLRQWLGDRVDRESAAASALVEFCGGSAAALCVAARLLRADGGSVEEFVLRLERQDLPTGPTLDALFDTAYERLDEQSRRCYRTLGAHPGSPYAIRASALAYVLGVGIDSARDVIETLFDAGLVYWISNDLVRQGELVRRHATGKAGSEDGEALCAGFVRYYHDYGLRCAETIVPGRGWLPDIRPLTGLDPRRTAQAWLVTEEPNLVAAIHVADDRTAVELCLALWPLYSAGRNTNHMVTTYRLGAAKAEALGDEVLLSVTQTQLGFGYCQQRDWQRATEMFTAAAHTTSTPARATAIEALGLLRRDQGDVNDARELFTINLHLAERIGLPRQLALARFHHATVLDTDAALAALAEVRDVFTEEPETLIRIDLWRARKLLECGRGVDAAPILIQARRLAEQIDAQRERGLIMMELAAADPDNSEAHLRAASKIFELAGLEAETTAAQTRVVQPAGSLGARRRCTREHYE